jgi:broad specificity phosphatase PhoE
MTAIRPVAFWYLRHGQTDWNAHDLAQGGTDVPLNERGREQAREAAGLLRAHRIAGIVASPMSRARETAEIVAEALGGLPIATDTDLREACFGEREGRPMDAWFQEWIEGTATPARAESFEDLRARGVAGLNRALARPAPVLVVAHGSLFRALRQAMGLAPTLRMPNGVPTHCAPGSPWVLTPAA